MTGTFTLYYGGSATSLIAWNATAATIQAALEALPTIGVGNVAVTVSQPKEFDRTITLEFRNAKAGQNVAQVTINTQSLTAAPLPTLTVTQRSDNADTAGWGVEVFWKEGGNCVSFNGISPSSS